MMLGLGVLRWSPRTFWSATPRELMAAWDGLNGGRPMEPATSHDLKRLMEVFPDR